MERERCESSTIASIGYDPETSTLEVEFLTGDIYQYFSVPAQVHAEFAGADSCGKYLNQHIKGRYRYQQL